MVKGDSQLARVALTERESEVAKLLCAANPPLTMQQISIRLGIKLTTLKGHVSRMITKHNVDNARQLTIVLLQNEINNSQVVVMKRAGEDGISSTLVRKSPPELAAEQLVLDGIAYVSPQDAPAVVAKFLSGNQCYNSSSPLSPSSLSRKFPVPEPT